MHVFFKSWPILEYERPMTFNKVILTCSKVSKRDTGDGMLSGWSKDGTGAMGQDDIVWVKPLV